MTMTKEHTHKTEYYKSLPQGRSSNNERKIKDNYTEEFPVNVTAIAVPKHFQSVNMFIMVLVLLTMC